MWHLFQVFKQDHHLCEEPHWSNSLPQHFHLFMSHLYHPVQYQECSVQPQSQVQTSRRRNEPYILICTLNYQVLSNFKFLLLLQETSRTQMTCWSFWSEMKKISQPVESVISFPTKQQHVWKITLKQFISQTYLCILALTVKRNLIPRSLSTTIKENVHEQNLYNFNLTYILNE